MTGTLCFNPLQPWLTCLFLCESSSQGNKQLHAGLTLDGVLARDLQLRPSSKFAYLLRPLPARAEQLNDYATRFRRRILRVVALSRARKRCGQP